MTSTINITAYSDALVVLGTAGIVVPMLRRLGLNAVLGYLCAGALLGPLGIGSFVSAHRFLYWFTIVDAKNVSGIAELGIVFLFFLIGLETSLRRLMAMRLMVFGLGNLQVVLTSAVIFGIALMWGMKPTTAIILGASLSLSSTAIVLELLSEQKRLTTSAGRAIFSILFAQDLAVMPVLLFIAIVGGNSNGSVLESLVRAFVQATIALSIIVVIGRLVLRPLLKMVAALRSGELFIATVLFIIVGAGVLTLQAGLSMSLGAFVAGSLLAETEYRRIVESTIEPFKGLLLGIFFFTVGMGIDFRELLQEPLALAIAVVALIAIKAVLLLGLTKLFRLSWPAAIETSLLLGPGGEFAFVAIGMAAAYGLVDHHTSSFALFVTTATMAITPLLSTLARRIKSNIKSRRVSADPALSAAPAQAQGHAIIVGYGRVGKVVCSLLQKHEIPYVAADYDAVTVTEDRRDGHEVFFGDATDPKFLDSCGLMQASAIIVTTHDRDIIDQIVEHARARREDITIVSRAWDARHAQHLYTVGVTEAVPEAVEASLQLSQAALIQLGIESDPASVSIQEKREEFRRAIRQTSGLVAERL